MEPYRLRDMLDRLDEEGGQGTWHISLYLRPDRNLRSAERWMQNEQAEAESIKSDETRDNVQDSLGKIVSGLQDYSETPENGLAAFASPEEVHIIDDLPRPVESNDYHCGKRFKTEKLRKMLSPNGEFGLVVIERNEAVIGIVSGDSIRKIKSMKSGIQGKHKAGGWSQQRFDRVIEEQKEAFFKDVASTMEKCFVGENVDGILIGGSTITVDDFTNSDHIHHELQDMILGTYSVDYASKQGLEQLVEKGKSVIDEAGSADQRDALDRFFKALRSGKAEYGTEHVDEAIKLGAVETLLISQNMESDTIEELTQRARQYGGDAIIVSENFEKGQRFSSVFGGVGAVLRFEV